MFSENFTNISGISNQVSMCVIHFSMILFFQKSFPFDFVVSTTPTKPEVVQRISLGMYFYKRSFSYGQFIILIPVNKE